MGDEQKVVIKWLPGEETVLCSQCKVPIREPFAICVEGTSDFVCNDCCEGDYADLLEHANVGLYLTGLIETGTPGRTRLLIAMNDRHFSEEGDPLFCVSVKRDDLHEHTATAKSCAQAIAAALISAT